MRACNQCGKCCIKYSHGGLSASTQEILWWDSTRPDIYRFVENGKIWVDPDTGQSLQRCPWLRKQNNNLYTCDIYYDRPEDCRFYPVTVNQMIEDQCEMLETRDLHNLRSAQKVLDKIMANSRPALDDNCR